MAADSKPIDLLSIFERVVITERDISAAHKRMDRGEQALKEELAKIQSTQAEIIGELKIVIAWMNRTMGWAAAAVFGSGFIGAAAVLVIKSVFKL